MQQQHRQEEEQQQQQPPAATAEQTHQPASASPSPSAAVAPVADPMRWWEMQLRERTTAAVWQRGEDHSGDGGSAVMRSSGGVPGELELASSSSYSRGIYSAQSKSYIRGVAALAAVLDWFARRLMEMARVR